MTTELQQDGTATAIESFKILMEKGIAAIEKAARIYVQAIDADHNAKKRFMAECGGIPPSAWAGFEGVGRGWIDKRLLWGGGQARAKLLQQPKSVQQDALDNGIEVLDTTGETPSGRLVKVEALTGKLVKQVFGDGHVRSLAEQRSWLASCSTDSTPTRKRPQWEVKGGFLVVYQPTKLTKREMAQALWALER